ncbi:hypothetical protein B0H16DRAFT_1474475 [Mycena metata]|uniref:Uncharacterized protein n=1 Tax=Mycena metata TaxID=1033252 RepID=A0AAD7HGU5_9AGAR|nr:hypothetical protein B0H16DRAFT_1474475 [Mycena metata]
MCVTCRPRLAAMWRWAGRYVQSPIATSCGHFQLAVSCRADWHSDDHTLAERRWDAPTTVASHEGRMRNLDANMPRRIERYVEENASYTPAVGRERGKKVDMKDEVKYTIRFAARAPLRNGPHIGHEKMPPGKDVDSSGLELQSRPTMISSLPHGSSDFNASTLFNPYPVKFGQAGFNRLFQHKLERKVDGSCTEYMGISSLAAQRTAGDHLQLSARWQRQLLPTWLHFGGVTIPFQPKKPAGKRQALTLDDFEEYRDSVPLGNGRQCQSSRGSEPIVKGLPVLTVAVSKALNSPLMEGSEAVSVFGQHYSELTEAKPRQHYSIFISSITWKQRHPQSHFTPGISWEFLQIFRPLEGAEVQPNPGYQRTLKQVSGDPIIP